MCAQNGSPEGGAEVLLIDGVDRISVEGGSSPGRLWTNNVGTVPMTSDFEIAEVIVFDKLLSRKQMLQVDRDMLEGNIPEIKVCMHHKIYL